MGTAPPTKREILLVTLLLSSFLLFINFRNSADDILHSARVLRNPSSSSHSDSSSSSTNNNTLTRPKTKPPILDVASYPHQPFRTRITWETSKDVPQTKIVAHVPGWTIFDRLYTYKNTIYIVSDDPTSIPSPQFILSKALYIENGAAAEESRLPTDKEMRVISTLEARRLFGSGAQIIDGVNFYVNDPPQFITHYYHWSAELWFGFWRTYSSLDTSITQNGTTSLPPPTRLHFPHLDNFHWRDYASMNEFVLRSSFPSISLEFKDDWNDRTEMGKAWVFERVVVADRSAAMLAFNYARYQRTAAAAFGLEGSVDWWQPIRNNVIDFAGVQRGEKEGGTRDVPVITYISRQKWGRRMLRKEDHEKLVRALEKLRVEHGYEVNIVHAEEMTRQEQIRLAARTTIMMGVHGNGLTSLIWMKPSPRSTVMEFFYPEGFAHDYEYTTRALGMVHYGFWNDRTFTSPALPLPKYVPGFQGNEIPVDAEVVARLCVERLSLTSELDD